MITVITATNRKNNLTSVFALKYVELLKLRNVEAKYLSMENLPDSFNFKTMYEYHHPDLLKLLEEVIIPAEKLVILIPEYNAGIPGVFKTFIDSIKPALLAGKQVALVGISSGRSGNIRGIDNLTNICHYLNMEVLPFKLPISKIHELMDEKRETITDEATIKSLELQIEKLLK
jgi:chromate reductase, NAD(P)H dehydrogenase (quinone)